MVLNSMLLSYSIFRRKYIMKNNNKNYNEAESRISEFTYQSNDTVTFLDNKNLQCTDCVHVQKQPGICAKFCPKPPYVLQNTQPCPFYENSRKNICPTLMDDGSASVVTHTPQCIGCSNNLGCFRCAVFIEIPEYLLSNETQCPARKEEKQP